MTEPTAEFLAAPSLAGLPHGFFTRRGGVSTGRYASLNCSLSGTDDPGAVQENRARAMRAIGTEPASLSGLYQVHGTAVAVVEAPIPHESRPRADGAVTNRPGVTLGIITADCGPVLFADARAGVVGACHAGWRGALAGVLEATIDAMEGLGARRSGIAAALGPCIRQPSYEVGADLREALLAADPAGERFLAPGAREGHWQFDMAGLILARLRAAGVAAEALPEDTLPDEGRFFSHRRRTLEGGGPIGHQLSAIALPG
ncbi:peptidoglycan editing factor PgeF [Roseomonas nepalensis]|uniref:Purine nucleoside phosphorylase n=1 Tax=Muricoccus nepalensis TaxID=1854500 RepID=A0A502G5L1_9PROT|nr:peptidoglycan editing factor PgeF [Roseomonas nepalensis]TPG57205.1 peptidoglycan editing factor PgeF [Roseomonas nepalensis]